MTNVTSLPKRGQTYSGGTPAAIAQSAILEGYLMQFKDEYRSGAGTLLMRSGRTVEAMLVRNVSAGVLLPGRVVVWKTLKRGKQVDGYCSTTAQEIAGIVDDQLPSGGVAINDLFWLIRKGPVLVQTPVLIDPAFVEGNILVALTAVTSGATTSGRPQVMALTTSLTGTTDGSLSTPLVNRFGRVMSAKTTNNSNSSMLIDLNVSW